MHKKTKAPFVTLEQPGEGEPSEPQDSTWWPPHCGSRLPLPNSTFLAHIGLPGTAHTRLRESPGAAVTKCHKLGGFASRNVFPHSFGVWHSQIKVWAELVSSGSDISGGCPFCPRLHTAFLLCAPVS